MTTFLGNLRRKSRKERQMYALSFSLIVTALVFVFWIFTALPKFGKVAISDTKDSEEEATSPLGTVQHGFEGFFDYTFSEFSKVKEKTNDFLNEISKMKTGEVEYNAEDQQ